MSEPRRTIDGLPVAEFGFPGELRDRLVALILQGVKTAGAGLLAEYEEDGEPVPKPGDRFVLVDSDERGVAVIESVEDSQRASRYWTWRPIERNPTRS